MPITQIKKIQIAFEKWHHRFKGRITLFHKISLLFIKLRIETDFLFQYYKMDTSSELRKGKPIRVLTFGEII